MTHEQERINVQKLAFKAALALLKQGSRCSIKREGGARCVYISDLPELKGKHCAIGLMVVEHETAKGTSKDEIDSIVREFERYGSIGCVPSMLVEEHLGVRCGQNLRFLSNVQSAHDNADDVQIAVLRIGRLLPEDMGNEIIKAVAEYDKASKSNRFVRIDQLNVIDNGVVDYE